MWGSLRSTGMQNQCVIMFAAARGTVRGYTIVVNVLQLPQNETPPQLCLDHIYYRPQRSCDQGNIFTPVCHSFCSQGGSASVHAGKPPGPDTTTPPGTRPP